MEFSNSKGVKWYLHKKMVTIGRNKLLTPVYFFKKKKDENWSDLPIGYKVIETPNGLPVVGKL